VKVIQQLIAHLQERGKLQPRQLEQLAARGYLGESTSANLRALEGKVGQVAFFQVIGEAGGSLWGTDVYTSDSSLAAACVHAGLLQAGQTGVVKVTMVQPPAIFQGSRRHGVVSQPWTSPWPGAYRVELVKK
jgi:hypothetical protein